LHIFLTFWNFKESFYIDKLLFKFLLWHSYLLGEYFFITTESAESERNIEEKREMLKKMRLL